MLPGEAVPPTGSDRGGLRAPIAQVDVDEAGANDIECRDDVQAERRRMGCIEHDPEIPFLADAIEVRQLIEEVKFWLWLHRAAIFEGEPGTALAKGVRYGRNGMQERPPAFSVQPGTADRVHHE